jgi:hypothetical protein
MFVELLFDGEGLIYVSELITKKIDVLLNWLECFESQIKDDKDKVKQFYDQMVDCNVRMTVFENMKQWYPEMKQVAEEQILSLKSQFEYAESQAKVFQCKVDEFYKANKAYIESIRNTIDLLKK